MPSVDGEKKDTTKETKQKGPVEEEKLGGNSVLEAKCRFHLQRQLNYDKSLR